jgi:hypothetical protein
MRPLPSRRNRITNLRRPRPLAPVLAVVIALLAACRDGDGAGVSPRLVAGTYALASVSGRGAVSGTMALSIGGGAVRRVRYAQPGGALSAEYVARGTFRLSRDGSVELQLREDDGRSPYVWQPHASLIGGVLALRYPDPADGPDIVESYRRF